MLLHVHVSVRLVLLHNVTQFSGVVSMNVVTCFSQTGRCSNVIGVVTQFIGVVTQCYSVQCDNDIRRQQKHRPQPCN